MRKNDDFDTKYRRVKKKLIELRTHLEDLVLGQGGVPLGQLLRVLHGGDQLARGHRDDGLDAVDLLACAKNFYFTYIFLTFISLK
jgi:hypothetical protein